MTLDQLKIGASGTITSVGGDGPLRCRLLDMGLIPRTRVTLQKIAPMGDPIEIRVRARQQAFFDGQLALAVELDLPVIVHDREAHGACLDAVCRHEGVRGVFHGFSGSAEMAKELVRREFFIAFGGALTYRGADRLRAVAASVPPDRLLLETDCPYMPPVPLRGTVNRSDNILHIARVLAPLHGMTPEELADITNRNAVRLFGLDAILPNLC